VRTVGLRKGSGGGGEIVFEAGNEEEHVLGCSKFGGDLEARLRGGGGGGADREGRVTGASWSFEDEPESLNVEPVSVSV
jgi:hypothetical protein